MAFCNVRQCLCRVANPKTCLQHTSAAQEPQLPTPRGCHRPPSLQSYRIPQYPLAPPQHLSERLVYHCTRTPDRNVCDMTCASPRGRRHVPATSAPQQCGRPVNEQWLRPRHTGTVSAAESKLKPNTRDRRLQGHPNAHQSTIAGRQSALRSSSAPGGSDQTRDESLPMTTQGIPMTLAIAIRLKLKHAMSFCRNTRARSIPSRPGCPKGHRLERRGGTAPCEFLMRLKVSLGSITNRALKTRPRRAPRTAARPAGLPTSGWS